MFVIEANVLAVGIAGKSDVLTELPIRLFVMNTAVEAVRCLHEEKIDMVISQWGLSDMPDGLALQRIIAAKPGMPTIAFIRSGDHKQEALARRLGVSVVLNENVDDEYFRKAVCDLLGIYEVAQVESISGLECDDLYQISDI